MRFTHRIDTPAWFLLPLLAVCLLAAEAVAQQASPATPNEPAPGAWQPMASGQLGTPEETLDDAWQIALATDQKLQASQWNVSSATRTWAAARAERFPSVSVGADYLAISQEPAFKLPASPVLPSRLPFFEQGSGGFHAIVTQPLYTFGRISSGIDAAEAGVAANQAESGVTRLDVKMNVAEIYVAVLRSTRLVEVAENRVVSLTAHTQVVEAMLAKGVVARTDLLAAQVALADARQQWMQARNGLAIAQASYNRALGRPLTEPVNLAELTYDRGVEDVEALTQEALSLRPELAQLSAQARALREQAAALQARKAPQVSLAGGYLYQQDKYIDPNGVAGAAVLAEWNVLDSGRIANQAAALSQKAEAAIRMRMDAQSLIALDVRAKWLNLQTARDRVEAARQATVQADENLRVARQRYQQQVGTNTEVLDAATLRVQAYTNFYQSTYEAALARLRLCRAVGNL